MSQSDLHIFTTGGTFDSVFSPQKYKPVPAEKSLIPEFLENHIRPSFDYDLTEFSQIDSADMTNAIRQELVVSIEATTSQKILIIHGTDTMAETARYLDRARLSDDKTVILTGAFIPFSLHPSDAGFNLGFAIAALQCSQPGIFIAMNGRLFPAGSAQKNFDKLIFEEIN
jgi:L-asparaginase